MQKNCTNNGNRVKAAMKAASKGKQSQPAYGKKKEKKK